MSVVFFFHPVPSSTRGILYSDGSAAPELQRVSEGETRIRITEHLCPYLWVGTWTPNQSVPDKTGHPTTLEGAGEARDN